MKVLLLAHRVPYPPNKGEKMRTYRQLAYLQDQGHEVVVVTPLEGPEDLQFATALESKLNVQIIHAPLHMRYLRMARGLLTGKPLSVTNFYSGKLQQQVNSLIASAKYDVLMCTSSAMAEYILNPKTIKIVQQQGIRLVMDFIDLDSFKWQQFAEKKVWPISSIYKREAKLLAKTESVTINAFDACLLVSADEKSLINESQALKEKVHVVSIGVDSELYRPSAESLQQPPDSSAPQFLFTGVMDYFPNEDAVIWFAEHVWPLVLEKYPQATFVIAGMRPSKKVSSLAKLAGIEVTGFIDDIVPYYQQADLMVTPFQVARGIQTKILQAMASGVPVIASAAGAAGISCTDGEDLLIADTPADYLKAINDLLNNPTFYQKIKQNGLDMVTRKYSSNTEHAKLEAILGAS